MPLPLPIHSPHGAIRRAGIVQAGIPNERGADNASIPQFHGKVRVGDCDALPAGFFKR